MEQLASHLAATGDCSSGAGLCAYPSAVTAQMVHNYLNGGTAIHMLVRQFSVALSIVDVGVDENFNDARVNSGQSPLWEPKSASRGCVSKEELSVANAVD